MGDSNGLALLAEMDQQIAVMEQLLERFAAITVRMVARMGVPADEESAVTNYCVCYASVVMCRRSLLTGIENGLSVEEEQKAKALVELLRSSRTRRSTS